MLAVCFFIKTDLLPQGCSSAQSFSLPFLFLSLCECVFCARVCVNCAMNIMFETCSICILHTHCTVLCIKYRNIEIELCLMNRAQSSSSYAYGTNAVVANRFKSIDGEKHYFVKIMYFIQRTCHGLFSSNTHASQSQK